MELYVVRVNRQYEVKYSAPCKNCLNIIKKLQIKKVIYSTENNGFEIVKPKCFNNDHITFGCRNFER